MSFEYEMTMGRLVFEWVTPEAHRNNVDLKPKTNVHTAFDPPLFGHPVLKSRETEIYLPSRLTHGRRLVVRGLLEGDRWVYDEARQTLFVVVKDTEGGRRHRVEVEVRPTPRVAFDVNDFWMDFGGHFFGLGIIAVAVMIYWLSRYWVRIEY